MQSDELTKSTRSWCEYCVRGRGKESPHLSKEEHGDDGICAFMHNTGDKDAKVTFLTMVDNSSGSRLRRQSRRRASLWNASC